MSENPPREQEHAPPTGLTSVTGGLTSITGITALQNPPLLEVRLLGSFEVRLRGELIDLHHRKADLLFACLAIFGNWVDRSTLEDMIWPDVSTNPIDKAAGVIRDLLGNDPSWLEVRRGKLRLDLKPHECDLTLFDRTIRQRDNEAAQSSAMDIYCGPLMPRSFSQTRRGHWREAARRMFPALPSSKSRTIVCSPFRTYTVSARTSRMKRVSATTLFAALIFQTNR